jgi:UDP-N-acetylmuramate dehydrogenase
MLKSNQNYSLKNHNTFAVDASCPAIYYPSSETELRELCQQLPSPFYVLGEGSNTLFIDENTPSIIKPQMKGIAVREVTDGFFIDVGCAENWHQLVTFCVERDIGGIENLALIPGSVGAAPVQNVGAYGVELADILINVRWFDFTSQTIHDFDRDQCQFGYRDSIFKNKLLGKGVITGLTLFLAKNWRPTLGYSGLDCLAKNSSIADIYQQVVAIRKAKLPDPKLLPNGGSFFKNPVVNMTKYRYLCAKFGDMPAYPQSSGRIKLAAGWLIEKTGLKGFRLGDVGIHSKQALVLVNYSGTKGQPIADLANLVQKQVEKKFGVFLEAEVSIISQFGMAELHSRKISENS